MIRSVLAGALAGLAFGTGPAAPGPVYQVYAVDYGTLVQYPLRGLVLGADSAARIDGAMMVWVVRGNGRVLLVDAGFYRSQFLEAWKIDRFVKPSDAIGRLGITPDQVTDLVISHLHWDHADGADLFPNARVWIQRAEYQYYQDSTHLARSGVFPVDMEMMEGIERAGRLRLVPGDSQAVAPGIFVYTGGRHTHESQYVSVPTDAGTVVLASDNAYLYLNLEQHRPIAATWDTVSNLAAQERMKRIASSPRLVVPGHDPAVFERFPTVAPGVVAIR